MCVYIEKEGKEIHQIALGKAGRCFGSVEEQGSTLRMQTAGTDGP